jgi:hypothetical protein
MTPHLQPPHLPHQPRNTGNLVSAIGVALAMFILLTIILN